MCLTVHANLCCEIYLPYLYINKFSIFAHRETKKGNQLNGKNSVTHNKIFEVVLN